MTAAPTFSVIPLVELSDPRGRLVVAEANRHIPFVVRRIFVISGVQPGVDRGGHAHRELHQFLMMMHGTCTVIVDTGRERTPVALDQTATGLHAPPMCWLELGNFSPGAVCAVLASDVYDEADYIRDRAEFDRLSWGDLSESPVTPVPRA